jgi:ribosomal 50S subunit-recycling heat shock protein
MRIDLALKYLCVVKSRSGVKHLCDDDSVLVNDHPVKPAATVRTGDKITIRFPHRTLTIKLLAAPEKQLSKSVSPEYYEKIAEVVTKDEDTTEY